MASRDEGHELLIALGHLENAKKALRRAGRSLANGSSIASDVIRLQNEVRREYSKVLKEVSF